MPTPGKVQSISGTTIVVSPRERFSSVVDSLDSLFSTIGEDVPVIVVEGRSPTHVRESLDAMRRERHFEWISLPWLITPQEARNIGFDRVQTEYVVFADNDIRFQPHWLERLVDNANRHKSDLVAPLICIGPPAARTVHHAGGRLVIHGPRDCPQVTERHRLMNQPIEAVNSRTAPVANEIVEFHCFLARSGYIRRLGCLDERYVTREQIDFGLWALMLGARVTFEANSVVTYMATVPFEESDLEYLSFRWSDRRARDSLAAFTSTWGITTDSERVLHQWIRPHRIRAYESVYPSERERLGPAAFRKIHVGFCEGRYEKRAEEARAGTPAPRHPPLPDCSTVQAMFEERIDPAWERPAFPRVGSRSPLVVAGMATMPSRRATFETALESLLPQVDRVFVFLDRFDEPPRLCHPKIVALDSATFGDHRANGKYLGLLFNRADVLYASADDDIEYPVDYIEAMRTHAEVAGPGSLVSVHGSVLHDSVDSYRVDRTVYWRRHALVERVRADVPSSCSSLFDTRSLWFDVRNWTDVNMVDLNLAMECRRGGITPFLVPRPENWLKELDSCQPDSIFRALLGDDSRQTHLARRLREAEIVIATGD